MALDDNPLLVHDDCVHVLDDKKTGFRRQILGFGRQLKGVACKLVAENNNIVLFACFDHYFRLNVC